MTVKISSVFLAFLENVNFKVRTFWETHIIWKNRPYGFDIRTLLKIKIAQMLIWFNEIEFLKVKMQSTLIFLNFHLGLKKWIKCQFHSFLLGWDRPKYNSRLNHLYHYNLILCDEFHSCQSLAWISKCLLFSLLGFKIKILSLHFWFRLEFWVQFWFGELSNNFRLYYLVLEYLSVDIFSHYCHNLIFQVFQFLYLELWTNEKKISCQRGRSRIKW